MEQRDAREEEEIQEEIRNRDGEARNPKHEIRNEVEEAPAWMAALSEDLQPLGMALSGAMQAALRKISDGMPEFLESEALEGALAEEFMAALMGDGEIRNGRWMTVKGRRFYKLDKGESREPYDKKAKGTQDVPSRRDPRAQEEIVRQKDIMTRALAAADKGEGGVVDLAAMPEAARRKMAEAMGRDDLAAKEITIQVEPQRLRHKKSSHGDESEKERGQRPLTDDDIVRRLPLVIADPDTVTLSGKTGDNDSPRLEFSRRIDAKHTVIVELRESRRRETRATPITHYVSNRTRPMFSPDCTSLTVVRAWTREDLP
jgi:hypothetical protein